MLENRNLPPNTIIICINFNNSPDFNDIVEEALALAKSAEYNILEVITVNRHKPDPAYFIGSGKLEEIKSLCESLAVEKLLINHNITPIQERNLDRALNEVEIVDRTQLILNIFASRAASNESILQIELALQQHLRTRLIRREINLDQQTGSSGLGGGGMRGPGETKLELDRRLIDDRVLLLKRRLNTVIKQRDTQRKSRLKNNQIGVSIVGYTNAGKSTLFNALTKANVYAEDRLFATLQTTSRKLFINEYCEIVLSDTVGFIRDLPTKLVAAFRATLEETIQADLLLHVVDVVNPLKERQIEDVNIVLTEIQANNIPQLIIYNKIDLIDDLSACIQYDDKLQPIAVHLSAVSRHGLSLLKQAITEKLNFIRSFKEEQEVAVYEPWKYK